MLLFRVQLLANSVRHIVLRLQNVIAFDISHKISKMVRPKFVMLLSYRINPTVRSEIAGWARTTHEAVHFLPV